MTRLVDNSSEFLELLKTLATMNETSVVAERATNLLLISSYALIFIVSLVGNVVVCRMMFGRRRMSPLTVTNLLILNLAVSDLLMTVINIPSNIARFVLDDWPFGNVMCVLVPFTQSLSVHCSSITMMFIAIERYKSIVRNKHLNDSCFCRMVPFGRILSIIWILSGLLSIPHCIYHKQVTTVLDQKLRLTRCLVEYPKPDQEFRQILTMVAFLTQYTVPILLTSICYLKISCYLCGRKPVGNMSEAQRIILTRQKRQRINMLITVVLVFAFSWLPLNVFHLLADFEVIEYSSLLFFITHWLAMSSVWLVSDNTINYWSYFC